MYQKLKYIGCNDNCEYKKNKIYEVDIKEKQMRGHFSKGSVMEKLGDG